MEARWIDFLRSPEQGAHGVQIYAQLSELAESVSAYLATGFAAGEPGIVVATAEHWDSFAAALGQAGWDPDVVESTGLLTILDATETLALVLEDRTVSPEAFVRVVGGVIDDTAARYPGTYPRVFGEMVDVLVQSRRRVTAVQLEGLWNELAQTRAFSLLCGYQLDVFDVRAQDVVLSDICSSHTHVRPAYDMARLDRAVHEAMVEVLGPASARMVEEIAIDDVVHPSAPLAQRKLLWVSRQVPIHAARVLASARAKYDATARVSV